MVQHGVIRDFISQRVIDGEVTQTMTTEVAAIYFKV